MYLSHTKSDHTKLCSDRGVEGAKVKATLYPEPHDLVHSLGETGILDVPPAGEALADTLEVGVYDTRVGQHNADQPPERVTFFLPVGQSSQCRAPAAQEHACVHADRLRCPHAYSSDRDGRVLDEASRNSGHGGVQERGKVFAGGKGKLLDVRGVASFRDDAEAPGCIVAGVDRGWGD